MHYIEGCRGEVKRRVWVDEETDLINIRVFSFGENYDIDLTFLYGKRNNKTLEGIYHSTEKLVKNSNGGLEAMIRISKEIRKSLKGRRPDGFLFGSDGEYHSELVVERSRVFYAVTVNTPTAKGSIRFDLGLATKGRVSRIENLVAAWETLYFAPYLATVKEHYLKEVN